MMEMFGISLLKLKTAKISRRSGSHEEVGTDSCHLMAPGALSNWPPPKKVHCYPRKATASAKGTVEGSCKWEYR